MDKTAADKAEDLTRVAGVSLSLEKMNQLKQLVARSMKYKEWMKTQPPPDPRRVYLQHKVGMRIREMSLAGVKITREILDRVELEEDEKLTEEEAAKRPVE